jgi:DNA-binding FadR family transcriptional regulator
MNMRHVLWVTICLRYHCCRKRQHVSNQKSTRLSGQYPLPRHLGAKQLVSHAVLRNVINLARGCYEKSLISRTRSDGTTVGEVFSGGGGMAKLKSGRLYAQVAREIAGMIASDKYPLGGRLPSERDLSEVFNVSRPTVREALIALEVDGLVEIRMGSGVYVTARTPHNGKFGMVGVGPFELLEARRAIESEACAMAALRAEKADLKKLDSLFNKMKAAGDDFAIAEAYDHQFHVQIARMTRNSAMSSAVESLWEARLRSPQEKSLSTKAHSAGVGPSIDDHLAILEAIVMGDPAVARSAMMTHLDQVLNALILATEVGETAEFEAKLSARREMFLGTRAVSAPSKSMRAHTDTVF